MTFIKADAENPVMVAALFVATGGCYFNLPDVEPWDAHRDARLYFGPHAVVAHPPCERWGRYARGGPNPLARRRDIGDDDGCFAHAKTCVERFGGVLEHPESSHAWARFKIARPPRAGGWVSIIDELSDFKIGRAWTCCVEQGHYGHRARKATWLYYVGEQPPPSLVWGPSVMTGPRMNVGFHSKEERAKYRRFMKPPPGMLPSERAERRVWLEARAARLGKDFAAPERMNKRERTATPLPFRDLLLAMARSARR